jgi:hypothetical protein
MSLNFRAIFHTLGLLLLLEVCFLAIPMGSSLFFQYGQFFSFITSFLKTSFSWFLLWFAQHCTQ